MSSSVSPTSSNAARAPSTSSSPSATTRSGSPRCGAGGGSSVESASLQPERVPRKTANSRANLPRALLKGRGSSFRTSTESIMIRSARTARNRSMRSDHSSAPGDRSSVCCRKRWAEGSTASRAGVPWTSIARRRQHHAELELGVRAAEVERPAVGERQGDGAQEVSAFDANTDAHGTAETRLEPEREPGARRPALVLTGDRVHAAHATGVQRRGHQQRSGVEIERGSQPEAVGRTERQLERVPAPAAVVELGAEPARAELEPSGAEQRRAQGEAGAERGLALTAS